MIRKVALVSPYSLGVFGGVQDQVVSMSRELVRRGHDVLVVAPDANDHVRCDSPAKVVRFGRRVVLPANGSRAPLTLSPIAAKRALEAVRDFHPDVVHFHEPFAPVVGWGVLLAHECAAVATFHRSGGGPALRYTGPLLRWLGSRLDASAAVSAAAASTIHEAARIEPEVLFNGFETEQFVESPRVRENETVIVTVGRLEDRKGTEFVVRAVLAHNERAPGRWRLVVIGDGPRRSALESIAAGDVMIRFEGALDDVAKRQWLRRASVVVAPATRGESFGLVMLEAMASEVPVVASDISGYREASGGHAVLFAPGDPVDLERAVVEALARETPDRLAAARRYAERWSMRSLVDAYESLYERAGEEFLSRR